MFFVILLILILLSTGWLPTLAQASKYSVNAIYSFLIMMIATCFLPLLRLHDRLFIHIGWIWMLITCVCMFYRIEATKRWWFISVVLSSASIAFSFHEIFHMHTDWTQLYFRVMLIFLFVCGGLFAYRTWVERICYLWTGLIITDGMILFAHQEMLNPIVIGEQSFLDTCWLLLFCSLLIHFAPQYFYKFRKQRW